MKEPGNKKQLHSAHTNGARNGTKKGSKQNGYSKTSTTGDDKTLIKKLIIADQDEEPNGADSNNNNSNSNSNNINSDEEEFSDMSTSVAGNCDQVSLEPAAAAAEVETSIGRSARDQFAAALLRLQADLDRTSGRLDAIETKVDRLTREAKQQVGRTSNNQPRGAKNRVLSGKNLRTLFYIGWPVLVFFAMRAIERRRSAARMVTTN